MPRLTRDQRLDKLKGSIAELQAQNAQVEAEIADVKSKLQGDPNTTVREHIRLLHDYNEIKDVAENLMSMVAEDRGVLKADVYKDFGVDPKKD